MTPRKATQQKISSLGQAAKSYVARLVAHRELIKRALFKGPKRILQEAHTKIHIIDKIKTFFGNTSGSIWILIASGVFLLYAAWSAFGPDTIPSIALHPAASDTNPDLDAVAIQAPTMSAPITNSQTPTMENQEATLQEPVIVEQTPVMADTIQHIYNMYDAINNGSYAPVDYFDSYMQTSDLVRMYFTTKRLTTLRAAIQGDINITDAEEFATDRRDRIGVRYQLNYKLTDNAQIFTETRAVTLRPQAGGWRIGTVRCETRGCSVNPFFNMEKYGIK